MAVQTYAAGDDQPDACPAVTSERQALCDEHYPRLLAYAFTLTGSADEARDVAQEAFVRLFTRWTSVRHPVAYLYLVATNVAKRHWRRRRSERTAFLEVAERAARHVPPYDPTVNLAIAQLPRRCRQVVVLHYLADLPVDAVAEHLRLAPGSVKRLLHESRARLAALLEDVR